MEQWYANRIQFQLKLGISTDWKPLKTENKKVFLIFL
jgi:hypothetical protein